MTMYNLSSCKLKYIMISFKAQDKFVVKMIESVELPESLLVEKEGKKSFQKTGKKIQTPQYTLISQGEFPEKLVFLSDKVKNIKENDTVEVIINGKYDNFNNINKFVLGGVVKV